MKHHDHVARAQVVVEMIVAVSAGACVDEAGGQRPNLVIDVSNRLLDLAMDLERLGQHAHAVVKMTVLGVVAAEDALHPLMLHKVQPVLDSFLDAVHVVVVAHVDDAVNCTRGVQRFDGLSKGRDVERTAEARAPGESRPEQGASAQ